MYNKNTFKTTKLCDAQRRSKHFFRFRPNFQQSILFNCEAFIENLVKSELQNSQTTPPYILFFMLRSIFI